MPSASASGAPASSRDTSCIGKAPKPRPRTKFDGTLYYQMHLTANVLVDSAARCLPPRSWCIAAIRSADRAPVAARKGSTYPEGYTPEARLTMIAGVLSIVRDLAAVHRHRRGSIVPRDYANYFYPYIRDQLGLPFEDFMRLYRGYGRIRFDKYLMFHVYCLAGYVLGAGNLDKLSGFLGAFSELTVWRPVVRIERTVRDIDESRTGQWLTENAIIRRVGLSNA